MKQGTSASAFTGSYLPGIESAGTTVRMNVGKDNEASRNGERGLTLVELIVTVTILSIFAGAVMPMARFQAKRQNERILHYDLWMMRDAIDRYKDAADKGAFQTKLDSQNYPPDLDTLVTGCLLYTSRCV